MHNIILENFMQVLVKRSIYVQYEYMSISSCENEY